MKAHMTIKAQRPKLPAQCFHSKCLPQVCDPALQALLRLASFSEGFKMKSVYTEENTEFNTVRLYCKFRQYSEKYF